MTKEKVLNNLLETIYENQDNVIALIQAESYLMGIVSSRDVASEKTS